MTITDWPEEQRPREKLLILGSQALSNEELLAVFLRTGVRGKSAVELAKDMLLHFGGLDALLNSNQDQFCTIPGLGPAKFAQLNAVLELTQRYLAESTINGKRYVSPQSVKSYLLSQLKHSRREKFACLFLNAQQQILAYEELFLGTIDSATVHPREVVKRALHHNAKTLIAVHNHPSVWAEISPCDRELTQLLKQALSLVEVNLIDHIIVADHEIVSFVERGEQI